MQLPLVGLEVRPPKESPLHQNDALQEKMASSEEGHARQRANWKRWYQRHLKKNRINGRKKSSDWYFKNHEKSKADQRRRRAENPALHKKWQHDFYLRQSPEKRRALVNARYAKSESMRIRIKLHIKKRKILKRNQAIGDISNLHKVIASTKKLFCFYCSQPVKRNDFHFDHVRPLSKGGVHGAYNLVISCPSCNCRKHDSDPNKFIKKGQLILVY